MVDTWLAVIVVVSFLLGWWSGRAILRGYEK